MCLNGGRSEKNINMSKRHGFRPYSRLKTLSEHGPPLIHLTSYVSTTALRCMEEQSRPACDTSSQTDDKGHFRAKYPVPLLARRYKYIRKLGEGISAITIQAEDKITSTMVAIKILHAEYYGIGFQEVSCLQELQQLDVDCITHVKLLNTFTFNNHFCMVMELLNPQVLSFVHYNYDTGGKQSLSVIRRVAIQMLQVLGLLRHANMIHADVKPDNILTVPTDCNEVKCKLVDFGSAIHCVETELSVFYDDFEIQTLGYRAPEVMFGSQFGFEIDMWSLGCTLAELYFGDVLFKGETKESVLEAVVALLGPVPSSVVKEGKFFPQLKQFVATYPMSNSEKFQSLLSKLLVKNESEPSGVVHFISFLLGILKYNPDERLSPLDAFQHPFLYPLICTQFLLPSSFTSVFKKSRGVVDPDCYTYTPSNNNNMANCIKMKNVSSARQQVLDSNQSYPDVIRPMPIMQVVNVQMKNEEDVIKNELLNTGIKSPVVSLRSVPIPKSCPGRCLANDSQVISIHPEFKDELAHTTREPVVKTRKYKRRKTLPGSESMNQFPMATNNAAFHSYYKLTNKRMLGDEPAQCNGNSTAKTKKRKHRNNDSCDTQIHQECSASETEKSTLSEDSHNSGSLLPSDRKKYQKCHKSSPLKKFDRRLKGDSILHNLESKMQQVPEKNLCNMSHVIDDIQTRSKQSTKIDKHKQQLKENFENQNGYHQISKSNQEINYNLKSLAVCLKPCRVTHMGGTYRTGKKTASPKLVYESSLEPVTLKTEKQTVKPRSSKKKTVQPLTSKSRFETRTSQPVTEVKSTSNLRTKKNCDVRAETCTLLVPPKSSGSRSRPPMSSKTKTITPMSSETRKISPVSSDRRTNKSKNSDTRNRQSISSETTTVKSMSCGTRMKKSKTFDTRTKRSMNSETSDINLSKPMTSETITIKPLTSETRTIKLMTSETRTIKPMTSETRTIKPMTSETRTIKPMTSETRTIKPMIFETRTMKPMTSETRPIKPMTSETITIKPLTSETRTIKPMTSGTITIKPMTSESRTVKSHVTEKVMWHTNRNSYNHIYNTFECEDEEDDDDAVLLIELDKM